MKKLNLNRNTFAGGETLTREQLKKIMGGDGPETTAPGDDFSTTSGGHCGNRTACSSGCATFTNAEETHGTCSNCCLA